MINKTNCTVVSNNNYRKLINCNNYFEIFPINNELNDIDKKYPLAKKDQSFEDSNFFTIVIEMTRKCPVNCKYCFITSINEKEKLSLKSNNWNNLLKLIDSVEKQPHKFDFCFHGGEPLLEFDLIKKTIEEIKKRNLNDKIKFSLQTSGFNLNKDNLEYLLKNNVSIGISVDSIDKTARDPKYALEALDLYKSLNRSCGVIIVVNKTNQKKLYKTYKKLVDYYKVKGILFNLMISDKTEFKPNLKIINKQIEKILKDYTSKELKISIEPLKSFSERILGYNSALCYDLGCGAFKRIVSYSVDGNFYGCDTFVDQEKFKVNEFNITKFNTKRVDILNLVKNMKKYLKCNECKYNYFCRVPCIGKLNIYNNSKEIIKLACDYNKMWIDHFLKYILKNPNNLNLFHNNNPKRKISENDLFYLVPDNNFIYENNNQNLLEMDYIKKSIFKPNNLLNILNSVAIANVPKYFGIDNNFLIKTKINDSEYIFTDSKPYSKNIEYYFNKLNINLYEFNKNIEIIRLNLDYYISKMKFSFISNSNDFLEDYTNYMSTYYIFLIIYHKIERKIEYDSLEDVRPLNPTFYNSVVEDTYFSKYFSNKKILKSDKIKIIKHRVNEIKKKPSKYYLYNLIDFLSYYLDSYYVFAKLLIEFIDKNNPSKENVSIMIDNFKFNIIKDTNLTDSYKVYNNLKYYMLEDEDSKLTYYYNISKIENKILYDISYIIKNYPRIPLNTLEIQSDLNVK